ncbi:hypothetical protein BJ878DRAFT_480200 [Calycina marina]|uniref:Uncharacterized protein n=1 Tax=Calycina marina TaxID=1763456 RepID=A0A9P7Z300_9HELO|nr:hypothetical protein BJ878DRAFT_480200 [Calycina marina]
MTIKRTAPFGLRKKPYKTKKRDQYNGNKAHLVKGLTYFSYSHVGQKGTLAAKNSLKLTPSTPQPVISTSVTNQTPYSYAAAPGQPSPNNPYEGSCTSGGMYQNDTLNQPAVTAHNSYYDKPWAQPRPRLGSGNESSQLSENASRFDPSLRNSVVSSAREEASAFSGNATGATASAAHRWPKCHQDQMDRHHSVLKKRIVLPDCIAPYCAHQACVLQESQSDPHKPWPTYAKLRPVFQGHFASEKEYTIWKDNWLVDRKNNDIQDNRF